LAQLAPQLHGHNHVSTLQQSRTPCFGLLQVTTGAMCREKPTSSVASSPCSSPRSNDSDVQCPALRTLEELTCDFRRRVGNGNQGFRSLVELNNDFRQRANNQPATAECPDSHSKNSESSTSVDETNESVPKLQHQDDSAQEKPKAKKVGTVRRLFGGKGFGFITPDEGSSHGDVFLHFADLNNGSFGDMLLGMKVRFHCETDARTGKLRARSASIVAQASGQESTAACTKPNLSATKDTTGGAQTVPQERQRHGKKPAKPATHSAAVAEVQPVYDRSRMLALRRMMKPKSKGRSAKSFPIRTVLVPRTLDSDDVTDSRGHKRSLDQDPELDDEARLAEMEVRLSRESGADEKNCETFGEECLEGWTFEQAVEANAKLSSRCGQASFLQPLMINFEDQAAEQPVQGAASKDVDEPCPSTNASLGTTSEDASSASEGGPCDREDSGLLGPVNLNFQ